MRLLSTIIFILGIISIMSGQKSYYKKGRAVVNNVKVLYQPDNGSYYLCKIETSEGTLEFGPKDIDEYQRRYGNVFISHDLGEDHFAFLERIVEGDINMYYLEDRTFQKRYFVQDASGAIQELIEKARRGQKDYKEVLTELWTSCELYSELVSTMDFNLASIKRIVETHNNCTEPYTPVLKKRFSVGVGYVNLQKSSAPNVESAIPIGTLGIIDISSKLNYQIAYTLEMPLKSSDVSLITGIRLSKFDYFQRAIFTLGDLEYEIDVNVLDLGIPIGLNYIHSSNQIRPYLTIQIVPSYLVINDVALSRLTFDANTASIVSESTGTGPSRFGLSGRLGVGVQHEINNSIEISAELGYDHRLSLGSRRIFNITGPYMNIGLRYKKEDTKKRRTTRGKR